jgi:hypothetical protein
MNVGKIAAFCRVSIQGVDSQILWVVNQQSAAKVFANVPYA